VHEKSFSCLSKIFNTDQFYEDSFFCKIKSASSLKTKHVQNVTTSKWPQFLSLKLGWREIVLEFQ